MAQSKRAVTVEDFKRLEVYSDPQFASDGKSYAFITTTVNEKDDYDSHIVVQPIDGSSPKQWTFGTEKNSHPRYSPDGSRIVFQSNRTGVPQLWLLPTSGGEAKQLTTFKNGAVSPEWSKDGKYIIFTASLDKDDDVKSQKEQSKEERKKEQEEKSKQPLVVDSLRYKSDAKGFHDDKKAQLVLYDVLNDTFTQLTSADTHHGYQDISPDGNTILFAGNLNDDADYELITDLYTLDIPTKEVKKFTNGEGMFHSAKFSPSGDKIACLGNEREYGGATLSELYVFDVATGERTCLSKDWDFQLGDAMAGDTRLGSSEGGPVWSKNEDRIFFVGTDYGAVNLYQVDLKGNLEPLYKENSHVFGFSYDPNNDTLVVGSSTPLNPCDFYLVDSNEQKQLTNANADFLEEVALSEPEELTVTAQDGWKIQGWLMRPYGFEEGKKYPFVLEVHGGPHAMYGQTFFHEMQLLAAKGYVVLYTNPRGSHGYGQEFVDACRGDYGGSDYTDLMSAVDYALENYSFIDENRLGVTGGSYGGFMTNWIVSHTNRFKAAVTQRSISNWLSFYGVSDIGFFFTKWEHGYNLLEDPEKLWDFSPLKYAANVETPLLILHGERDFRCPIEQGEQLFITLKHLRKEVEFVRFPGANHELSRSGKPEMRIERLNHICRWFEKYL
ncbi:S9 family peptidase [Ornithinibacillus halophilus]|uniref:Acylaminoacyl-peptidase n=1 Tax=Ornithinibacillus halophilus TaxID=930117 RepID=A0A1M5LYS0_9BACI|nr:S9 family peptidase [Ornithinibacillus halophilus]SHG70060.1 acylaminoacyl-peptidase [Ornithinibacillus halophilus]